MSPTGAERGRGSGENPYVRNCTPFPAVYHGVVEVLTRTKVVRGFKHVNADTHTKN